MLIRLLIVSYYFRFIARCIAYTQGSMAKAEVRFREKSDKPNIYMKTQLTSAERAD